MIKIKKCFQHPLVQLGLSIIPLLFALIYFILKTQLLEEQTQKILYLQKRKYWIEKNQMEEKNLLAQLKIANKEYVEKNIESLTFLQEELQHLQMLFYSHCEQPNLAERLDNLQNKNKIQFTEKHFQRVKQIQETVLQQINPVEMHAQDLKTLLSRIENISTKSDIRKEAPQLIIKNFYLTKKALEESSEVYIIKLDLIKRELVDEYMQGN